MVVVVVVADIAAALLWTRWGGRHNGWSTAPEDSGCWGQTICESAAVHAVVAAAAAAAVAVDDG